MPFRALIFSVLVLSLDASAYAQAHITLQANANPFPASRRYADVWGEGNYAYVGSDVGSGVLIFDISNPTSPVLVANYAPANSTNMEDVKVVNGIGYFASNSGGGVHIVDLSNPAQPVLLARLSSANGGYDSVHNVSIDDNLLYIPDYPRTPAVKVFDVTTPSAPVLVATIMTTDTLFIHDMTAKNGRLYTSGWGGHTDIYDVSGIRLGPPVLLGTILSGSRSHSCWPTDDGTILACTRELFTNGELRIYNIANPASPVLLTTITPAGFGLDSATPHDPRIIGNTMYVSFYQAGLAVFDISDPANPLLVGNYDTWPGPVLTQFDGNWGVDPDLGPNRVLLSDRNTGLYIVDTTQVSSDPVLFNLKLNPTSVVGGKTTTARAYLVGRAPSPDGLQINLTTTGGLTAAPLFIPPNGTTGTVAVNTVPVPTQTTETVSATYAGPNVQASLTVLLPSPNGLTVTPSPVITGNTATGKITLDGNTAVDTLVTLTVTSGASAVSMPPSVTIPAGTSSVTWSVGTFPVTVLTTVQFSALVNGKTKTASFSVQPNWPSSISVTPSTVVGGNTSVGKVTFGRAVDADTVVDLAVVTGAAAIASMPASVTVAAGTTSATWSIVTAGVGSTTSVQISATANGGNKTGTLTVTGNVPSSVTFTPTSVIGGNTSTGKVMFGAIVVADTTVTLTVVSGQSAVASIPGSVTVLAGTSSATWAVVTNGVASTTSVQVSAAANGGSKTGTLTVTPNTPTSVTFTPTSVVGGLNATGKVTFGSNVIADTVVTLNVVAGQSAVASMAASITVLAGTSSGTWTVATNAVGSNTSVQVSATANGGTKTGTLTVKPNAPTSVSFTPTSVIGGNSSTGKVTFGKVVDADTVVTLTITSGSAAVSSMPTSVTVPMGMSSATWTVVTLGVAALTPVQVSATANGGSKSGTLNVTANTPTSVTFTPTSVVGGGTGTGKVSFGRIVDADTTVTLTVVAGAAAVASCPATVIVPMGASSTTWPLTTAPVASSTVVQVSAAANGGSKTGSLTVNP